MRPVSDTMKARWLDEDKTGENRPVVRATIQKTHLIRYFYDTWKSPGGTFEDDRHRVADFTSLLFAQDSPVVELRNIKTCTWGRNVNQDVAECTLVILNSELVPIGSTDASSTRDDFDVPGAFTFSRGEPGHDPSPWGYVEDTAWNGLIVPDRLVKTYEGYGCDPTVDAALDPNLVLTGTWLIDEVDFTETTGEITVKMRDLGRLLLDQMVFPPCVPRQEYPLKYSKIRTQNVTTRGPLGGDWKTLRPRHGRAHSSNDVYANDPDAIDWTNAPYAHYVAANGNVAGHSAGDVLDANPDNFWQSTGQDRYQDIVWWQIDLNDHSTNLAAVRITAKGGPYKVYLSVKDDTGWCGVHEVPYEPYTFEDDSLPNSVDIGAAIEYVKQDVADADTTFDLVLPRKLDNVRAIRLLFSRLIDTQVGEHPFNARLGNVAIYTAASVGDLHYGDTTVEKAVGNYTDYTDVVKWICSWGGFHWPAADSRQDYIKVAEGHNTLVRFASPDPALPRGRVWGDFMRTGTAGDADLTPDLFDKKPLMDVISYVRDIVNFNFWIDETGAAIWRMPNRWSLGNYVTPLELGTETPPRTDDFLTLTTADEAFEYGTTLSSKNSRERIFVANSTGKTGVVIKGYQAYSAGLRRVAGWTDEHFKSRKECIVMADFIAAQQMFDYRRGSVTISGFPGIQIDDQVRIFAPVTNETYYHYVEGIQSTLDMTTGEYTYTLSTHWLGENPEDAWVVDVDVLEGATRVALATMGAIKKHHADDHDDNTDASAKWTDVAALPTPQPARLLGAAHPHGDLGVYDGFGHLPDIGPSWYRHDHLAVIPSREKKRMQHGISPFISVSTTRSQIIADTATGDHAWVNSYVDMLNVVAGYNPSVTVFATLDRRWERMVREQRITGASATVAHYAAALDYFIQRVHGHGAANLEAGYSYGGPDYRTLIYDDTDTIGSVLSHLTRSPDWIAFDTWVNQFGNQMFNASVSDNLNRLRTGLYGADYVRLGSPDVIVGAFGMNTENHIPSILEAYYTDLRTKLATKDLRAAIFDNSLVEGSHRVDDGHHRAAAAAFGASLVRS